MVEPLLVTTCIEQTFKQVLKKQEVNISTLLLSWSRTDAHNFYQRQDSFGKKTFTKAFSYFAKCHSI